MGARGPEIRGGLLKGRRTQMRNRGSASRSRPSSLSWHPLSLPHCRVTHSPWSDSWDRASSIASHPWSPSSDHQSHLAKPRESLAEQSVPAPGEVAASSEFPREAHRICIWADLETSPDSFTLCLCTLASQPHEPHFPHLQNGKDNSTQATT